MKNERRTARLRVLVASGCDATRPMLGLLLRLWGHDARICRNDPDALGVAASFRPEVVLIDAGPHPTAWALARLLRQSLPGRPLLVALSDSPSVAEEGRCLEAGCDLYRVKPIDPDELELILAARKRGRNGPPRVPLGLGPAANN